MDLDGFEQWLLEERGLTPGSVDNYLSDVRAAYEGVRPPTGRLLRRDLAPKTVRRTLAALRAYAKYTEDDELARRLGNIKLPPADRKAARVPLAANEWRKLRQVIDAGADTPIKAVIGMMAVRGFRIGDCLRMQRDEVITALQNGFVRFTAKGSRKLEYGVTAATPYLKILAKHKNWNTVAELIAPTSKNALKAARMKIRRALHQLAVLAKLPPKELYPHRLRRTVAVEFLKKTKDVVQLTKWMQWRDVSTAMQYVDHDEREALDKIGDSILDDDD